MDDLEKEREAEQQRKVLDAALTEAKDEAEEEGLRTRQQLLSEQERLQTKLELDSPAQAPVQKWLARMGLSKVCGFYP